PVDAGGPGAATPCKATPPRRTPKLRMAPAGEGSREGKKPPVAPARAPARDRTPADTATAERTRLPNTTRSPSTISAQNLALPRPPAAVGSCLTSMRSEHPADSKNEAASNAIAIGL